MNIDEIRLPEPDRGREYERTVQCAWCTSHSVAVIELGGPRGRLDIVYGCVDCKRPTLMIIPFNVASNRVYLVRCAKRITFEFDPGTRTRKRVECYMRVGRELPDWHNREPDDDGARVSQEP